MSEQQTQSTEQFPSIGQQLRQAREAAGMSLVDVAQSLNLTKQQITHLEQDEFDALGPIIFTKGYIRSYCKLFSLDESRLLAPLSTEQHAEPTANMQSFSKRTEKEANDSRLMLVSYLIVAVVIGLSVWWWWQNSAENSVKSSAENNTAAQNALALPSVSEPNPASAEQNQNNEQQNPIQQNLTQQSAQQSTQQENNTAQLASIEVQPQPEPQEVASAADLNEARLAQAPAPSELSAVNPTETPSLTEGQQRVNMTFAGESWIEVVDATGKRLAYEIKKAGQSLALVGTAPFAVILGKHEVVTITLNGEAVDISSFPKNRLAKFNLPLTE